MLKSIDSLGGSNEYMQMKFEINITWLVGFKKEQQILASKFYGNNFIVKAYKPYKLAKGRKLGTWY